ncbi:MAG: hypothetical protein J7501_17595 [Bdellovibrio sp.]|nr:hypothetical protein [Bdellovibrio sp.]
MNHSMDLKRHPEVRKIFDQQLYEIALRADRSFAILMGIQWLVAILMAWQVFPHSLLSQYYSMDGNVLFALVVGGFLALPPIFLVLVMPGTTLSRMVIATGQMCFSVLLIHLSGGRIETHFHILISLALLAFYKDTSVIALAAALAVFDHALRGHFMPLSIYGEVGAFSFRWFEHAGWILFEMIGLIIGVRFIRRDLKEMAISKYQLIIAREEAVRASGLKSMFLSNMSHEIRTPLNSILGFTEILSETNLDEDQKQYVSTIHRCSDSLLRLLNDILDLSKIENGLLPIEKQPFDIHELHKDVHSIFAVQCRDKGLSLQIQLAKELPSIAVGDSHRIRQVLINLVGNAVKFTSHGRIHVQVEHDKESSMLRWHVRDTGVGISAEVQEKLFKPFAQADASISRKFGGSGLGLLISKNLVEMMGGKIQVASQLGEGTTFTFTLPYEGA